MGGTTTEQAVLSFVGELAELQPEENKAITSILLQPLPQFLP